MREDKVNQFVIILMVIFISAIFLSMIKSFLLAIFLAGIFAAITRPVYLRLEKWLRGRYRLAAGLTLLLVFLVVLIPLVVLTTVVTGEAIKVSQSAMPWAKAQLSQPGAFTELLESTPFYDKIAPHSELIVRKASEVVGQLSRWLVNNLSAVTMGAVSFIFTMFILLYTMYFFLIDGETLLERILYYLPMQDKDEQLMLDKFTSVTRATLKGTAVVGVLQGGLAGLAFMVVGIPSATFWGVIMVVLSIIPSVGTALVWIPAAVILAVGGAYTKAIGLALFCAARCRQRGQPAPPGAGGQGHPDARADDSVRHLGGHFHVRHGRHHHRSDHCGPVRDHLGDLRTGLCGDPAGHRLCAAQTAGSQTGR